MQIKNIDPIATTLKMVTISKMKSLMCKLMLTQLKILTIINKQKINKC